MIGQRCFRRKRIQSWDGNVVLFELNALIKLYKSIKGNFNNLDKRRNQLYERLINLFKQTKTNKHYTFITEVEINNLINEVLQKDEDISQLNYEEVFLCLKSDKIK